MSSVINENLHSALNRFVQESYDAKEWHILTTGMRCFTQFLLTIEDVAVSGLGEAQMMAKELQELVFQEAASHDRVINLVRSYRAQGFEYLDACTELSSVFLRLLRRFSTSSSSITLKSSLSHFLGRFISQQTVDTFVMFTRHYNDFDAEQMKRAHRFFHLVAFREKMDILLFRVDILLLFHSMIKGTHSLNTNASFFGDWDKLVRELVRQLRKRLHERGGLLIELLFSKTIKTMDMLQGRRDRQNTKKKLRTTAGSSGSFRGRSSCVQVRKVHAGLIKSELTKAKRIDYGKSRELLDNSVTSNEAACNGQSSKAEMTISNWDCLRCGATKTASPRDSTGFHPAFNQTRKRKRDEETRNDEYHP